MGKAEDYFPAVKLSGWKTSQRINARKEITPVLLQFRLREAAYEELAEEALEKKIPLAELIENVLDRYIKKKYQDKYKAEQEVKTNANSLTQWIEKLKK